jgi:D-tyrosyl-tRNA(Tyr) deacylase
MRAVVQRVSQASVVVGDERVGAIGRGLVVLVGVTYEDTGKEAHWLARKVAHLRIFEDEKGKMNRSVLDVGGAILCVSQFTLYADTQRGNRPGFTRAARPEAADPLIEQFIESLREWELAVESGVFGAHMRVEIHNDGPVTIILDTPA